MLVESFPDILFLFSAKIKKSKTIFLPFPDSFILAELSIIVTLTLQPLIKLSCRLVCVCIQHDLYMFRCVTVGACVCVCHHTMLCPRNEWHSSHGHTSTQRQAGQWWARSTQRRCHSFHSGNGPRTKPGEPEEIKVQRSECVCLQGLCMGGEKVMDRSVWLTWAIIPMKAHSLNIFRGTLTRYWRRKREKYTKIRHRAAHA